MILIEIKQFELTENKLHKGNFNTMNFLSMSLKYHKDCFLQEILSKNKKGVQNDMYFVPFSTSILFFSIQCLM